MTGGRSRRSRSRRAGGPSKLVLAVIDGLRPEALERAVADGRAPSLAAIIERGAYVDDCVAAFPSVTPGVHVVDRHRHRTRPSIGFRR